MGMRTGGKLPVNQGASGNQYSLWVVWCLFFVISKIKIQVTGVIGGLIEVWGISEVTEQRSNCDIHQQQGKKRAT